MASHLSENPYYQRPESLGGSARLWNVHNMGSSAIYSMVLSPDTSLPSHLVITGISPRSMEQTSQVICNRLHVYEKKYHMILIVKFCYNGDTRVKDIQEKICKARDENENKTKEREELYRDELQFYDFCAIGINKMIQETFKLKEVEVLGKCAGGCIAIHLVTKSPIYTALYLAVPGSPTNCKKLHELGKSRMRRMRFLFGWAVDDNYLFPWGNQSKNEKEVYDYTMDRFSKIVGHHLNYRSRYYGSSQHEVPHDMIDDICNSSK
jgi:hypothetical protein